MRGRTFAALACGHVAACLLLGGASAAGVIANMLLQLGGIAIAILAILRLRGRGAIPRAGWPFALLAAILLIGPLQLVPLPPAIWTALPGRGAYAEGLKLMGVPPQWLGISLAPGYTLGSTLALLPAAGAFLAVLALDGAQRMWVAWTIVGAAALSLALGLAQLAGGDGSPLYFYEISSFGSAVGFFSNRNHLATLLLSAMPLVAALATGSGGRPSLDRPRTGARLVAIAAILVLAIGVVATSSRAGLALLFPDALLTFALVRRTRTGVVSWPIVAGALLLSVAALTIVFYGPNATRIVQKSTNMAEDEIRFTAAPVTARIAVDALPVGTGLGTFDPMYRANAPTDAIGPNFVNHAHDDYLELFLTAGVPGLLVLLGFFVWYVRMIGATWRQRPEIAGTLPRAAVVVIGIVAAHSVVDYPLRTAAMSCVFAVCCALLVMPAPALRRRSRDPEALPATRTLTIGG